MISLLIYILILCLIFGLIFYIVRLVPLPHPFGIIAQAVVGVVFVIILLYLLLGALPGTYSPRLP